MKKWFKISLVGLLVVGAVAVLMTGIALAQEETPTTPENTQPFPRMRGNERGLGGEAGLAAAAEALGMTTEELSAELWAGKTLADIAEEKGVDLVELYSTVQEAVTAARVTAMQDAINQAVEAGNITQENADWLLEGIDKGFIPGFGFGLGGRGGHRGLGDFKGGGFFGQSAPAFQASPSTSG
jgi:hypothetical protein